MSHRCWFESIYKDKYEYMGEFDLMSLAFTMDLGFYYLGIVFATFQAWSKIAVNSAIFGADFSPVFLSHPRLQSPFRADRPASPPGKWLGKTDPPELVPHSGFYLQTHRLRPDCIVPLKMGVAGTH